MKLGRAELFFFAAIVLLVGSVFLGVISIYSEATGETVSRTIIADTFHLSPNEERRQGLGNFHGNTTAGNESITVLVEGPAGFVKNFSIITYSYNIYSSVTAENVSYTFPSGADYYEVILKSSDGASGVVNLEAVLTQPGFNHPYAWLCTPAKALFLVAVALVMLALLQMGLFEKRPVLVMGKIQPDMGENRKRLLVVLLLLSLLLWLTLLVVNSGPLATFDNWYTDHARHSYTANLFLKDGLAVFSEPMGKLASADSSAYMFVTWPEMPHLYPIGSVLLFLPFGALIEAGVSAILIYKLEIALFLVFAHVCLYYFFCRYSVQRPFPRFEKKFFSANIRVLREGNIREQWGLVREYFDLGLLLAGVYIIYFSLVTFAADGMFDSLPFLFGLLGVLAFLARRYDACLLLVSVSVLFKYQAGIFLFPLIIVAAVKLLENSRVREAVTNRKVLLALAFACVSGFTAYLSAPYLVATRPELVMNGINAFAPNAQIEWPLQAFAVLLTLAGTLVYALYMLGRNKLLSLSAVFMLLPAFVLPYFQNWYLPYMFVYVLIPQRKNEFTATLIWLIYMVVVLSYGASGFNPGLWMSHYEGMVKSVTLGLGL